MLLLTPRSQNGTAAAATSFQVDLPVGTASGDVVERAHAVLVPRVDAGWDCEQRHDRPLVVLDGKEERSKFVCVDNHSLRARPEKEANQLFQAIFGCKMQDRLVVRIGLAKVRDFDQRIELRLFVLVAICGSIQ